MSAMPKKKNARANPQIKVTIPKSHWDDVKEAMEYDGATRASQFALAAIMQRVRRLKQMKAADGRGKGE